MASISKLLRRVTNLNCWTPPPEAAAGAGAAAGVGSGFGGVGVGAELSPVSTSMRTEPTFTVSCTYSRSRTDTNGLEVSLLSFGNANWIS